jgi:putative addiction module CopG family antidote
MSVTLTPELEDQIQRKVDAGLYRNPESVVREALRLLDAQDRRLQRLRAAIAEGEEGDDVPWTPELMEKLTREAEEMIQQGIEPDPDVCP